MITIPEIRLARVDDAQAIAAMSRDLIEQGLGWSWTQPRVRRAILDKATNVAVVQENGRLLAFGIMNYGDDAAHLSLLAVLPAQRRRGLAAQVLSWLEASAAVAGIASVRLEARADNPEALLFYRGQGYAPLATVPGYYSGAVDAVRLEKRLGYKPG